MSTFIHNWSSGESFPGSWDSKESACNASDLGSTPGLGRSPGDGNGNPLRYPCLENTMDRGSWQTTVHGVTKGQIHLNEWGKPYLCLFQNSTSLDVLLNNIKYCIIYCNKLDKKSNILFSPQIISPIENSILMNKLNWWIMGYQLPITNPSLIIFKI